MNYVQEYFEEQFLHETTKQMIQKIIKETRLAKQDSFLLRRVVSIVLQRVLAGKLITELPPEYVDYVRHNEQIEELMYHLEITYNVTLSQWERSFISFPFNINTNHIRNSHEASVNQTLFLLNECHGLACLQPQPAKEQSALSCA